MCIRDRCNHLAFAMRLSVIISGGIASSAPRWVKMCIRDRIHDIAWIRLMTERIPVPIARYVINIAAQKPKPV